MKQSIVYNFPKITLRPSILQAFISHFFLATLAVGGMIVGFFIDYEYSKYIALAGCVFWMLFLIKALYLLTFKVDITDDQIIVTKGPFIRSIDYIELYRVYDYSQEQSIGQRILGLRTIYILSGDKSCPNLKVVGIKNGTEVITSIRYRVEYNKKKKGIYEITNR